MSDQLKYIQRLSRFLFISGLFNVLLITLLIYAIYREQPPAPYFEHKPRAGIEQIASLSQNMTNAQVIRKFRSTNLKELLSKLSDSQIVENGYTKRDLALSSLVSFHGFDLERALEGQALPAERR